MKLTEREEFLADFMVQYPVADMRTMCMAVEGIFSPNPFAKNALTKGSYTVRNMVAKKLMSSRKDGYYSLHKKVVDEFYDLEPYYKVNGSESTRKRIASVAWIAAAMRAMGVSLCYDENEVSFACSTVWRSLNPVVSNTSRYAGVLNLCIEKYAVYDVSDSNILWQREAEESLFIQTPKNKNVSLDGILMLTDKALTEQTIDIVLRSIKSKRGWKKTKVKNFSLKSYAPITVSKNFKRAYLMNYKDFARQIGVGLLLKYTPAKKWLEKYFDNQFSFEESGIFDCVICGKKAFWYYHNDIIKLMTMITLANNLDKEIAVVCDYRLKDIVEFFLQDKVDIYIIEKEFYIERGVDKNGSFNIAERIARSIKNREDGDKFKKAYELLAKMKFELLRNYDELNFIETEKVGLNEVRAFVEDGIVILEFDEALPCQKVDDAYANRVHWREMMNGALKKLFENFENVPSYEKAIVCVEVHKTSDNWDISNRMLNLVVNMLKGNFMPDDNITNLVIAHKGKKSNKEKTVIYIGNYYIDMEKVLKMWS